ncbi:MAG: hypothetical protein JNL60_05480 [Bacteroidia bacterium]|nr:hypothetical protein [Bacteroidia bacterium]
MKRTWVLLFAVLICSIGFSQEKFGISNSNYSSSNSIFLNPSSSVDCRTYIQYNIAGAQVFAKSNFGYLPNFKYSSALQTKTINRSNSQTKQFLYAVVNGQGPGLIISKRMYGGGFFTRIRNVTDMRNVSYQLASAFLNENGFNPEQSRDLLGQDIKNARLATMTWAEYGINFGKMIKRQQDIIIALAGNIKYNTGVNIYYANLIEFDSFTNADGSFGVNRLDGTVRNNQAAWKSGRGWGLDLGITYKIMEDYVDKYLANSKLSNCNYVDYKIKIGLSLLDLGYVRFKTNTTRTDVSGAGYFDPKRIDTAFTDVIKSNFKNETVEGKPITATLPTALSGQMDYNFDNDFYLNVTVVKNLIPTRMIGVPGADVLVICPRYETLPIEVGLPFALQKFRYPNLGFMLRLRSMVFGVDNIFPLFMARNTNNVGVYFSLGISLFRNPACKTKRLTVADCIKFATGKGKKRHKEVDFGSKKKRRRR